MEQSNINICEETGRFKIVKPDFSTTLDNFKTFLNDNFPQDPEIPEESPEDELFPNTITCGYCAKYLCWKTSVIKHYSPSEVAYPIQWLCFKCFDRWLLLDRSCMICNKNNRENREIKYFGSPYNYMPSKFVCNDCSANYRLR